MRAILYALTPLAILIIAICIASLLGYLILMIIGDEIALRKIISKTTLVLLIFSIFPAMSYLGLSQEDIGFTHKRIFFKQIAKGLIFGVIILAPVIAFLIFLGLWELDVSKSWSLHNIVLTSLGTLTVAFLVAIPEESLFRGILQTSLGRKLGVFIGITLSAFYYAGLHFLKSKQKIPYEEIELSSGFYLFTDALSNLVDPANLGAFIALFSVGVFLSTVRHRLPQSIGLCIGLHAGWVFLIKMTSSIFDRDRQSEWTFLTSHYDGIIGPLVAAWLIMLTLAFVYFYPQKSENWFTN